MHIEKDVFQMFRAISVPNQLLAAKLVERVIASLPADSGGAAIYFTPPAVLHAMSRHMNQR